MIVLMICVPLSLSAAWSDEPPVMILELNKLENRSGTCRMYFLIINQTPYHYKSLEFDLVVFDNQGIVERRLGIAFAPLPPKKTSLRVFDIQNLDCARIGHMLINDVLKCDGAENQIEDCLSFIETKTRAGVPLID